MGDVEEGEAQIQVIPDFTFVRFVCFLMGLYATDRTTSVGL
jgi:hypothetical protein